MVRRILCRFVIGAVLTIGAGPAIAQGQGPNIKYKKETRYDFDDDLVEGELQRPEGDLVTGRRGPKHSSLIKIRQDFIPEMIKSAENI